MRHLTAAAVLCSLAAIVARPGLAEDKPSAEKKKVGPVLKYEVESLEGKKVDLSKYGGKVLMIVNVASQCGATPQYEPLQALHEEYKDQGFAVLGFPCNQFGKQEPGTATQIREFCTANYGVTFDMFSKIDVNGENRADLYEYLTSKDAVGDDAGDVKWNFEKFLVSRDGKVIRRFRTRTEPDSRDVVAAIEKELAKK